jgi:hypothetical protein
MRRTRRRNNICIEIHIYNQLFLHRKTHIYIVLIFSSKSFICLHHNHNHHSNFFKSPSTTPNPVFTLSQKKENVNKCNSQIPCICCLCHMKVAISNIDTNGIMIANTTFAVDSMLYAFLYTLDDEYVKQ